VPEELEEILSPSSRETRSSRRKAMQSNARGRRASSVDVIHTEMKKVRNVDATSIAVVSPIAEELAESEDGVRSSLQGDERADSKATQGAPPTPKRTKEEGTAKPRRGRWRKTSVSRESSALFSFSLPEKTNHVPLDEEGNLKQ